MRFRIVAIWVLLAGCLSPTVTAGPSAEAVVRELYQQIVARRPLGIPRGVDKAAIWPLLSKRLIYRLETAQACENSYFQQHAGEDGKPGFGWLEVNLFSGGNEQALPSAAVVERTSAQKDGSLRVYVRLRYKESFATYGRPPDPANTFRWRVAASVISEDGRFVIDDILFLKDDSTDIESRLTRCFPRVRWPTLGRRKKVKALPLTGWLAWLLARGMRYTGFYDADFFASTVALFRLAAIW